MSQDLERPDFERIAVTVQACPAVAGLHGGPHDTIATSLPRGQLVGVAIDGDELLIAVVGRYPATVTTIADQVRAAATAHAPGYRIVVSVEDLHVPDDAQHGPSITLGHGPSSTEPPPPQAGDADQPDHDR